MWENPWVRASPIGDVLKIWAWALGSMALGLWLTPFAYNGGKALAELSASKDFNGFVNQVAAWSREAELDDFFKICWLVSALVLLVALIEWLQTGGSQRDHLATPCPGGRETGPGRRAPLQALTGFLLTFGGFLVIGYVMVKAGAFRWARDAHAWSQDLAFDIGWALIVAAVIEIFFRRVMLGIFLGAMRSSTAIALAAVMFAGTRFVLAGFAGTESLDGESLSAIHLTGILFGAGEPLFRFVVVFMPWFAFGCVLGWARWRTASMWLPASLLTGWLLAGRLFEKATDAVELPSRFTGIFAVGSVQSGIIPLIGALAIGVSLHLSTRAHDKESQAPD